MSAHILDRFWSKVDQSGECWIWTASRDGFGYGMFRLGPGRVRRAHRIAWEIEHGPVREGTVFLHSCDNPPCVRPSHVRPGTRAQNNADRDAKGRHVRLLGERHGGAKLTAAAVADIRRQPSPVNLKELADRYGVSPGHIYNVRRSDSRVWRGVA